jgi:hypothetical protein
MQILFMGQKGKIEASVVPQHGFAWRTVPTVTLNRPIFSLKTFITLFKYVLTWMHALNLYRICKYMASCGHADTSTAHLCCTCSWGRWLSGTMCWIHGCSDARIYMH